MLRDSLDLNEEYTAVENAVQKFLDCGYRTADIMEDGKIKVGCAEAARLIADMI